MLIHIGDNDFVNFQHCEAIINLETVSSETRKNILAKMPPYMRANAKAAILTTEGKWISSTISTEALAQRGGCHPFNDAEYLNPLWKQSSHYPE